MRIRASLVICIILLIILSGCGSIKENKTKSTITPTPTPTPIVNIINTKISDIKIETAFPAHMIVNQSYLIRVALVSKTGSFSIPQTLEQATMAITEPTPVGTPDATVQQAFGPGFLPSAVATLNAGTFKVLSAPLEDAQYLDQPVVGWEWNVTPQFTGTQILSVDITAKWDLTQSAIIFFKPQFRIGDPQLSIAVTEPPAHPAPPQSWFTIGQFNLINFLSNFFTQVVVALIGVGSLSALILWLRGRGKNRSTP